MVQQSRHEAIRILLVESDGAVADRLRKQLSRSHLLASGSDPWLGVQALHHGYLFAEELEARDSLVDLLRRSEQRTSDL